MGAAAFSPNMPPEPSPGLQPQCNCWMNRGRWRISGCNGSGLTGIPCRPAVAWAGPRSKLKRKWEPGALNLSRGFQFHLQPARFAGIEGTIGCDGFRNGFNAFRYVRGTEHAGNGQIEQSRVTRSGILTRLAAAKGMSAFSACNPWIGPDWAGPPKNEVPAFLPLGLALSHWE